MESLNLNKLLNQFLDWKITSILHCGSYLQTDLYKRFLRFKGNVPINKNNLRISYGYKSIALFLFTRGTSK